MSNTLLCNRSLETMVSLRISNHSANIPEQSVKVSLWSSVTLCTCLNTLLCNRSLETTVSLHISNHSANIPEQSVKVSL